LTLPFASIGGGGIISGASHWAGGLMGEMLVAYAAGDVIRAAEVNGALLESYRFESSDEYPNPVPAKAACRAMGLAVGQCRLPNAPATTDLAWSSSDCGAGAVSVLQNRQSVA
jgi:4-hydroxy-tetrahydrodipicolinate synthase